MIGSTAILPTQSWADGFAGATLFDVTARRHRRNRPGQPRRCGFRRRQLWQAQSNAVWSSPISSTRCRQPPCKPTISRLSMSPRRWRFSGPAKSSNEYETCLARLVMRRALHEHEFEPLIVLVAHFGHAARFHKTQPPVKLDRAVLLESIAPTIVRTSLPRPARSTIPSRAARPRSPRPLPTCTECSTTNR